MTSSPVNGLVAPSSHSPLAVGVTLLVHTRVESEAILAIATPSNHLPPRRGKGCVFLEKRGILWN